MYFLPKANPLYEQITTDKVLLPELLEKLGKGHFTGYLNHAAPGFESYCVFAKGKLICAISSAGELYKTGFEAITLLFDKVLSAGGEINISHDCRSRHVCPRPASRNKGLERR